MPDLQGVIGQLAADDRPGGNGNERSGDEGRHDANNHRHGRKQRRPYPHARRRVVGMGGIVVPLRAEEDVGNEAEGVGNR